MSGRKSVLSPIPPGGPGRSTVSSSSVLLSKKQQQQLPAEYRDACDVLNIDTMNHACRLLLQGYGDVSSKNVAGVASSSKKSKNKNETDPVEEELLGIYNK